MGNILSTLTDAIATGRLAPFLMGEGARKSNDPLIETPTDLSTIFISGFNEYVRSKIGKNESLQNELTHAFEKLLQTAPGTWWTISIIYSYLFGYKKGSLLFSIDISSSIPSINRSLAKYKEDLKTNKDWVGWRFREGLWEDVSYMVARINEKLQENNLPTLIV